MKARDKPTPWHSHSDLWRKLKPEAKRMRSQPTPAEALLWRHLRGRGLRGFKFRRQHPIDRFIVDFYCAEARLIVEVDGPIHEHSMDEDANRTELLEGRGMRVLRFKNEEAIGSIDTVLSKIADALTQSEGG